VLLKKLVAHTLLRALRNFTELGNNLLEHAPAKGGEF